METKIVQLIERLCEEKQGNGQHCDVTSSRIHIVNTPIPADLYQVLETLSSEYNRDIDCLAGDFLTLALQEAIEHIPRDEKIHLDEVQLEHDHDEVELLKKQCEFNAGGT